MGDQPLHLALTGNTGVAFKIATERGPLAQFGRILACRLGLFRGQPLPHIAGELASSRGRVGQAVDALDLVRRPSTISAATGVDFGAPIAHALELLDYL